MPLETKQVISTRSIWLDALKGLAMLAVVYNHLYSLLYDTSLNVVSYESIMYSIFSVTTFIFVSGFAVAISISKVKVINSSTYWAYLKKRYINILIPYVFAAIVVNFYLTWHLNLKEFVPRLFNFDLSAVFYYIPILLQLLLVAPFLVKLFSNLSLPKQLITLVILYVISWLLTRYTTTPFAAFPVFGGNYLLVLGLSIFFYFNCHRISSLLSLSTSVIGLVLFLCFVNMTEIWSNPPKLLVVVYSVLIILGIYGLFKIPNKRVKYILERLFLPITYIGKNSLHIYLYHSLIISVLLKLVQMFDISINPLMFNVIAGICSIVIPLVGIYIVRKILRLPTAFFVCEIATTKAPTIEN